MNNLSGAARRMTRNFDQFSVICVFGSVVGCVVLPLMVQSMESFIITFVVLCLTAKPLRGRLFPSANQTQETERRKSRDKDDARKSKKSSPKKKHPQVSMTGGGACRGEQQLLLKFKEEDLQKQEEERLQDRERRLEEKRVKKARKREERLQRKEEEKREKEREEQVRRERQEARIQRKREDKERKQKAAPFEIPTRENIQAIVNGMKPLKRERKNSTSSSASSISAHSTSYQAPRFQQNKRSGTGRQHSAPFRAASDPEISMATRSSSTPVGKPWPTTLPSTTGSSHWYTDIANRSFPSLPIVTSAPSSVTTPASRQPQLSVPPPPTFPPTQAGSFFSVYPLSNGANLQRSTRTTVPGSMHWSGVRPTSASPSTNHHQQVCELPLHPHLPPQTAWLPVSGAHPIHGSETIGGGVSGGSAGGVRYFSPAPGTVLTAHQQQQAAIYNGSLLYNNSTNSGYGISNDSSNTGVCDNSSGQNCYSLFSSGGRVGNTVPFSPVGCGLLNLDTSSTDHMRHQVVSTGSPLSVGSDVSDGQNSTGGADSYGGFDQLDAVRLPRGQVETIGSTDKGRGVSVGTNGKQLYDEWPNL